MRPSYDERRRATFSIMKAIQAKGVEWREDHRAATPRAPGELLEGRMHQVIDGHLERMTELGRADCRSGRQRRRLLSELGAIEVALPGIHTFAPLRSCGPGPGAPGASMTWFSPATCSGSRPARWVPAPEASRALGKPGDGADDDGRRFGRV